MIFFRSHKLILAVHSPTLGKQLMKTPDTLTLPDLTKEQVSQVLELVYKGRIEVPSDKNESFLQIARNLGILGLPKSGEEKSNNKGVESEPPKKKFKKPDSLSDETTSVVKMKRRCDKEMSSSAEKKGKRKKSCDKQMSNCDEETTNIEKETSNGDEETTNFEEVKSKHPKKMKVERCGLESLPDEVIVKIISHLSTRDLIQNVALVSKRFKSLSEDHGAHIIVNLDSNVRVKGAVRFLRKAISLQELHISYPAYNPINVESRLPKGLCGEILLAIADHAFVKVVNVSNQCASVSEEEFVQLSKTKLFRSLIKLVLPIPGEDEIEDDNSAISTAIASLSNAKNMTHLDLGNGYDFVFGRQKVLLDVALACERIHTIKPISNFLPSYITKLVRARKETLRYLDLDFEPMQSPSRKWTLQILSKCTKLQKLKFSADVDPTQILTTMEYLTDLQMTVNRESDFKFAFAPNSLPKISTLTLTVNNHSLIALANACPNLKELQIVFVDTESREVVRTCERAVREFVVKCPQLEVICIDFENRYEDGHVNMDHAFENVCDFLPNLKILYFIWSCRLSEKRVKKLLSSSKNNLAIKMRHSLYLHSSTTWKKIAERSAEVNERFYFDEIRIV
jgi:hypothetical protein